MPYLHLLYNDGRTVYLFDGYDVQPAGKRFTLENSWIRNRFMRWTHGTHYRIGADSDLLVR